MDSSTDTKQLFDARQVDSFVKNITMAILDEFSGESVCNIAFIGIQQGGIPLARRISGIIKSKCDCEPPVGTLDLSMYRDDIGMRKTLPLIHETNIPFDINRKVIILVDDVLQTGRSIRAALDAVTDYGRPAMIRLATLIDRGRALREFPIRADYIGECVNVPRNWRVNISWAEYTGEDVVSSMPRK